jgi:hypothetical protein
MSDYRRFIASKCHCGEPAGVDPVWLPDYLHGFQRALVEWSVRKGRAGIFADCGLGKTPMQLVWAENVVRFTNRPVLIVTVLGDSAQTVAEGQKFGVEVHRSKDGKFPAGASVVLTNYERLHLFDPGDFAAAVANESSVLKDFDGKRKAIVTEFFRTLPYRLLCTATAAPNDYVELGTSAEALGEMGFQDMVTRFFHKETKKDYLGWGRTKYRMRSYAESAFWRWVCSWARAVRKPSDLGFDDGPFVLPELTTREHVVKASVPRTDVLFDLPAATLPEQREERRRTLPERCEKVAELVNHDRPAVVWCHLNAEADLLERLIPDAVQVSGADADDAKEDKFEAFAAGRLRVMVTKPRIGAFGLNWQHCAHETFFPSHSYEQFYQGVRRCWRFGQTRPVVVDVVSSEGEAGVLANLQRKADAADRMFSELAAHMSDELRVARVDQFGNVETEVPPWLCSTKN